MALNTDYDIEKAFRAIEDELIASMIRNLEHHMAEETKEGFNWTQWQVEQIKALERYKAENKKKFTKSFSNINDSIEAMIFAARQAGGTEQEQKILRAIKKGFKASKVSQGTEGAFFKLNTRKLDALIKATKADFTRAEHSMLRMSEDKYRQIYSMLRCMQIQVQEHMRKQLIWLQEIFLKLVLTVLNMRMAAGIQ